MTRLLRENSLLILTPKSSVTLFTPDRAQANTHQKVKISDSELLLVHSPKLLGVYLDTFFSFNKHFVQVANRVSKRTNVLKALAGTNCGQQLKVNEGQCHNKPFFSIIVHKTIYNYYALDKLHTLYDTINQQTKNDARPPYRSTDFNDEED